MKKIWRNALFLVLPFISSAAMAAMLAGTLVQTSEGPRAVETLEVGDQVLAYNAATSAIEAQPVTSLYTRVADRVFKLEFANADGQLASVYTTAEHPFYIGEKTVSGEIEYQWKQAQELKGGDLLFKRSQQPAYITKIEMAQSEQRVFGIEVAQQHNYFAFEGEVLVHNQNGSSSSEGPNFAVIAGITAGTVLGGVVVLGSGGVAIGYGMHRIYKSDAYNLFAQSLQDYFNAGLRILMPPGPTHGRSGSRVSFDVNLGGGVSLRAAFTNPANLGGRSPLNNSTPYPTPHTTPYPTPTHRYSNPNTPPNTPPTNPVVPTNYFPGPSSPGGSYNVSTASAHYSPGPSSLGGLSFDANSVSSIHSNHVTFNPIVRVLNGDNTIDNYLGPAHGLKPVAPIRDPGLSSMETPDDVLRDCSHIGPM